MEAYFVGSGSFVGGVVVGRNFVGDALGNVVQPDVVTEIEEYAGYGDGNAQGEAEVQGAQLFMDVQLVEVLEDYFAFLAPYVAELRSAEDGKAVGAFFDEVVAVNHRHVDAMDGRRDGGFGRNGAYRGIVGQWLFEGDVATIDVVGYFRLKEVAVEVDAHEEGAEVADFIIVLHFVDSHPVDAELGDEEEGRGETAFYSEVHRMLIVMLGMLFVGSAGHNGCLSPNRCGGSKQT